MNEPLLQPRTTARPRTLSLVIIVQWAWLLGLSILVIAGWRSSIDAEEPQATATTQRSQAIEARLVALEESNQARLVQAPPATQQALQSLRESLEGRLQRLEQQAASEAPDSDLQAMRVEVEALKTQQAALKVALTERAASRHVTTPVRAVRPTAPREEPLPFRVLGVERRAGQLSLSVVPGEGALAANRILVMLPGESLGKWRLESVAGGTAVFRAGEHVRRLAIP